jgi:hypothetical protein
MIPINDFLKRIEDTKATEFVLGADKVIQALQTIAPGFYKLESMVNKSLTQIQEEEKNNPENAKKLSAVFKAEGNASRLDSIKGRLSNLNESYEQHLKVLESRGLGFIRNMKPEDVSVLTHRIKENVEIKKAISENLKEFGMTFDDLPTEAKNAIIDKPTKKNNLRYV